METTYNGSESSGEILVVVGVLTGELSAPVTVRLSTMDATALSPADYQSVDQTLTFTPDQRTLTISVPVVDDQIDENDETLTGNLELVSPDTDAAPTISPDFAVLRIDDNDSK